MGDQKHCAPHIATVKNSSPRHVGMLVLWKVECDRVLLWVYHIAFERKKTPSILWNSRTARIEF